jgi:predicted ArsR family transcriptional regulator
MAHRPQNAAPAAGPGNLAAMVALGRGESTQEMAEQLFISAHTVRDHLKSISKRPAPAAAASWSRGCPLPERS